MKRFRLALVVAIASCQFLYFGSLACGVQFEWARDLTTAHPYPFNQDVSADGLGNVYVAGGTASDPMVPAWPAHLAKYDAAGNLAWVSEFGNGAGATAVSADKLGYVYVAGITGDSHFPVIGSGQDLFLRKYDAAGNLEWDRQLASTADDRLWAAVADGMGSVYIAGATHGMIGGVDLGVEDAFLAKYDDTGNLHWIKQFGSDEIDSARGVSADSLGNVFVSGGTRGAMDGPNAGGLDVFLSKYDSNGSVLWTRQLGTPAFEGAAGYGTRNNEVRVSADGLGGVYIAGITSGSLGGPIQGVGDLFLARYNSLGDRLWIRQFGGAGFEAGAGVSADGLGNVYVSGDVDGGALIYKFDGAGNQIWLQQLSRNYNQRIITVSADGVGSVFISGWTQDNPTGVALGFVAKYSDPVPEPTGATLGLFASTCLALQSGAARHRARLTYIRSTT